MLPKVWVGAGDERVGEGLGQVPGVGLAERDVAARRVGGGEGVDDVLPRAVGDARGLEEKSTWRIKENWENLRGGQVTRETNVAEGGGDDERGGQQGEEHPRAEEGVALAGFVLVLFEDAPPAPLAQDGDGGGHGLSIQGNRKEERRKIVESLY